MLRGITYGKSGASNFLFMIVELENAITKNFTIRDESVTRGERGILAPPFKMHLKYLKT
ncbi:MAG: hypothetical protein AAF702_09260 [Chloroflexota bacterium]